MLSLATWLFLGGLGAIWLIPIEVGGISLSWVARGLWLLSLGLSFLVLGRKKIKWSPLLSWWLIFSLVQGISGVEAIDLVAFAKAYGDFMLGSLSLILGYLLLGDKKWWRRTVNLMVMVVIIDGLIQLLLLFKGDWLGRVSLPFLHKGFYELMMLNWRRARLYLESWDEALIPLFLGMWVRKRGGKKWGWLGLAVLILGLSLVSNFRTRALLGIGGVIWWLLADRKVNWKQLLVGMGVGLGVIYLTFGWADNRWGFNVMDRLLMRDRWEDVLTVKGRLKRWSAAAEMGEGTWLGVGMGNYYDNLRVDLQHIYAGTEESEKEFKSAVYHPHNVFLRIWAETGWVGEMVWVLMLIYFVINDGKLIKKGSGWLVGGFWLVLAYTLINPGVTMKYWSWFWLWRLLIERYSILETIASE